MRLIDADELIRNLGIEGATKYGNRSTAQQHKSYDTFMAYEILDEIESAPTIHIAENTNRKAATIEEAIEMLSAPCYENKNYK